MSDNTDSDDDPTDGMEQLFARMRQAQDDALVTLAALCDQLAKSGITTVRLQYDGYADSGTIDLVTAFVNDQEIGLDDQLKDQLRDAGYELLPGGWEIDCGSFGELVIDVPNRKLTREHNQRVEDSEYEEESYEL